MVFFAVFKHGTFKGKRTHRKSNIFSSEYESLGAPSARCDKCSAIMWKKERVNKKHTKKSPIFHFAARKEMCSSQNLCQPHHFCSGFIRMRVQVVHLKEVYGCIMLFLHSHLLVEFRIIL